MREVCFNGHRAGWNDEWLSDIIRAFVANFQLGRCSVGLLGHFGRYPVDSPVRRKPFVDFANAPGFGLDCSKGSPRRLDQT